MNVLGLSVLFGSAALMVSGQALAEVEKSLTIGAGASYDDNASRSLGDEDDDSDVRTEVDAQFGLGLQKSFFSIDGSYSVRYSAYQDDSQEERLGLSGNSSLVFHNSNKQLTWSFENSETETLENGLLADTNDNRQRRSTYSSGPSYAFNLSKRDTLNFMARASAVRQDREGSDTDRLQYSFAWSRSISNKTNFSLNTNYSDVEAKDRSQFDYTQAAAILTLQQRFNGGSYSINAGYSELERSGQATVDAPQYGLTFNTDNFGGKTSISFDSKLIDRSIGESGDIRDSGRALSLLQPGDALDYLENFNTNSLEIVTENNAVLSHSVTLSKRSSIGLSLSYSEYDYENIDFKEERSSVSLNWSTELAALTTLNVDLRYGETNEGGAMGDGQQERSSFDVGITRAFSQFLNGSCSLRYQDREGDLGSDYESSLVGCRLTMRIF